MTYGAFEPDADGREYFDLERVEHDFALIAARGMNAVRIPHTTPPRALLDVAARHGLWVMVGLSVEQQIGYQIDDLCLTISVQAEIPEGESVPC